MQSLKNIIKEKAFELGFCKVGIAPITRLDAESLQLQEWLSRGYHASMSWMERGFEKRIDPTLILPEAKSMLCVAMNYYTPVQHSSNIESGKISRYAWGDDYHEIIQKRLETLLEFIKQQKPETVGKVYVDTGPVMDKVWAQRAGIGWEGKHTNVISQEYGSWLFLGEIILNIEFEYDFPTTDHCGDCTLCIEACPTDAIVEPYVVDANKCISYLTIEHRSEIAKELGEKFDKWIYGCDICQDVCPWNHKFGQETEMQEFSPREFNQAPLLEELASITQEEFSKRFHRSPVKRTKVQGLRRNAQVILDTMKQKEKENT